MQPKSDAQLLRDYAERGVEAAFAELAHRHTNLVYSAALRQVGSPEAAAEIAQAVFVSLARGAESLSRRLQPDASLAGWLCRAARNLSLNFRRDEFRRQAREREAMPDLISTPEPAPEWEHLRRVLDEAMSNLNETDYDALVLRFFQDQDFRSVGVALGVSDDAAQKRVTRALEKLRELLAKRGVGASAAGLAALIGANAVQAAPTGLAVTISASVTLLGTSVSTSTFIAATKTIAMTTFQKTCIGLALTALAATGIYEARQAAQMRERTAALEQQQAPLVGQVEQLRRERDDAVKRAAALQEAKDAGETAELAKLRGEVQRLRKDSQELDQLKAAVAAQGSDPAIEATLRSWAARANQMKQRLEQMPEKKIPEMGLLTEKEWLDAAKNVNQLETDEDYRKAFANLRNGAKGEFGQLVRNALKKYLAENNGLLPNDLSQLQMYFERPVDDAVLQRYALLESGKISDAGRKYLVGEKASPVDEEFDSRFQFSFDGTQSRSVDTSGDLVLAAMVDYAKANNGQLSRNPAELTPYLSRVVDATKLQNILAEIPPGIQTLDQLNAARNSR
jgi:RNA polymerase sigma factor (sigma-70 family)